MARFVFLSTAFTILACGGATTTSNEADASGPTTHDDASTTDHAIVDLSDESDASAPDTSQSDTRPSDTSPSDPSAGEPTVRDDGSTADREGGRISCGEPNEPCCDGYSCAAGGCCVYARCVASGHLCAPFNGTCNAGACGACGGLGLPCCGVSCTAPATRCVDGTCAPCGREGGPCCAPAGTPTDVVVHGGICSASNLVCDDNADRCVRCGGPGEACCSHDACNAGGCCFDGTCTGDGQSCGAGSGGTCHFGRCTGCGAQGQPCCGTSDPICAGSFISCFDGQCVPCGGAGQMCCANGDRVDEPRCVADYDCAIGSPSDTCEHCGAPGEACCPGDRCSGGACCFERRCMAEGASCQTSTDGLVYGTCRAGRCTCGRLDEPCCPEHLPDEPSCVDSETACSGSFPGTCKRCGIQGAICCSGGRCRDGATECVRSLGSTSTCEICGSTGQPCCPGANKCKDPSNVCVEQSLGPDLCVKCGGMGEACCPNGQCDPGTACVGAYPGTCTKCGTAGTSGTLTICCSGHICNDGSCCVYNDTTDGPVCIGAGTACGQVAGICGANGACGNCGALNQPCCGGGSISGHSCTASGTTCVEDPEGSFTCRPCGDLGQRCCYEPIGNLPVCRATLRCVGPIDSQSCMP